jgi:hypothetical protein
MKVAKKKAEEQRKAIQKKKLEDKKFGIGNEDYSRHMSNYTPSSSTSSQKSYQPPMVETKKPETTSYKPTPSASIGGGMQLGKSKASALSQMLKEENVVEESPKSSRTASSTQLTSTTTTSSPSQK